MSEKYPLVSGVRPLWSDGAMVIAYRKGKIAAMDPALCTKRWQVSMPSPSLSASLVSPLRLARRVLRMEPTDAVSGPCGGLFINQRSTVWRLDLQSQKLSRDFTIPNQRNALALCNIRGIKGFDDGIYLGDYFDNPGKNPVRVWRRQAERAQWDVAHVFPADAIDHIHNIVPDPHRECVWILTGDFGQGAALWQARNNFRDIVPVVRGKQLYRATWLYTTPDALYYATDTQLEQNYLCRLSQNCVNGGWEVERLLPIPGSSIYGAPLKDGFLFSTAVEPGMPSGRLIPDLFDRTPGPGINGTEAHVFHLNAAGECTPVLSAHKDMWPMRLMLFGTYHLCSAPDIGAYAYGVGVTGHDGRAIIIPQ